MERWAQSCRSGACMWGATQGLSGKAWGKGVEAVAGHGSQGRVGWVAPRAMWPSKIFT